MVIFLLSVSRLQLGDGISIVKRPSSLLLRILKRNMEDI